MFDDILSQRHFDEAERVGAIMTMNVQFQFRNPHEKFGRDETMNIKGPGTKVTPEMAVYVAKSFLKSFEDIAPIADLTAVSCSVEGTDQKVFDIDFHVKPET